MSKFQAQRRRSCGTTKR